MERSATCLFGLRQYGVDINGYVVDENGDISVCNGHSSLQSSIAFSSCHFFLSLFLGLSIRFSYSFWRRLRHWSFFGLFCRFVFFILFSVLFFDHFFDNSTSSCCPGWGVLLFFIGFFEVIFENWSPLPCSCTCTWL